MDDREPLSRLTEREKVCLRQWLQHRSAKEIAAEIGISHHAVEKRLKMARTKLGATSSLEAARMLGEAEGYGRAVAHPPELASDVPPPDMPRLRLAILGVVIMSLAGAIVLALFLQPATSSQTADAQSAAARDERAATSAAVPTPGTEAALRTLVAGLVSGAPDYAKLAPEFADIVRRDLPTTHRLFSGFGALQSVTFRERGPRGDDVYTLAFANGGAIMSARLDAQGRMAGGILQPLALPKQPASTPGAVPAAGTEAALRGLVAGLASGAPDYAKLSPQFADIVRRDLPVTHRLFGGMGALQSMTFRGRGAMGDDVYSLTFANGGAIMSAALDDQGRMTGGILQPVEPPRADGGGDVRAQG